MMLHGAADELVPEAAVAKLVHKLSYQRGITIDYRLVPGAGHFFNEHLDELTQHIESYLNQAMHQMPLSSVAA